MSLIKGVIKAVRPKQWAKNLLVFVAPLAAGLLTTSTGLRNGIFAFCVFSMASGGTYLINDVLDVESDRQHPTKRSRPIASGVVPIPLAVGLGAVFIVTAVLLALWRTPKFGLVVAIYVILTTLYSVWMKHEPVLDLVGLSAGFILRLLGGAYAAEVGISDWFLIISLLGALFIAAGKRSAERNELGDQSSTIRPTLGIYTDSYLDFVKAIAGGGVVIAYCLFAVERAREHSEMGDSGAGVWVLLSILPFVVAILRYALLVDQGAGSAPEEVLLHDRQMAVIGLVWVACFGMSVLLGEPTVV